MIKIRELEERLKAEQIRTAQIEKELAKKKEAMDYWKAHDSHIQYQKDLKKLMTLGGIESGDLQRHAEKLLNEQIWITQSYHELCNKWEKEQRVHKECQRKVSQLQKEYGQLAEESEQLKAAYQHVQDELEEDREYGMWFEKENKALWKKLESCQAELARLNVEETRMPKLEIC